MTDFFQTPWYVAGLAFECTQCGRCCAGPEEGYVWITDDEIVTIANTLHITPEQMRSRFCRQVHNRCTIVEQRPSNDCAFLRTDDQGRRGCSIYSVRPRQCRTWPFWASNLGGPHSWALAGDRCPGINRGRLFSVDEIRERLKSP